MRKLRLLTLFAAIVLLQGIVAGCVPVKAVLFSFYTDPSTRVAVVSNLRAEFLRVSFEQSLEIEKGEFTPVDTEDDERSWEYYPKLVHAEYSNISMETRYRPADGLIEVTFVEGLVREFSDHGRSLLAQIELVFDEHVRDYTLEDVN